MILMS